MTETEVHRQARAFDTWWLKAPGYRFIRDGFAAWADSKQFSPQDRERIWEATQPELLEAPW